MKKLIKLSIVCENCEVYDIEADDITSFYMSNITEQVFCDMFKSTLFIKTAGKLSLELENKDYQSNWGFAYENGNHSSFLSRMMNFRDIASVCLYFKDDPEKEYQYYVDYEAEDALELGSPNIHQRVKLYDDDKYLIIEISREENKNGSK